MSEYVCSVCDGTGHTANDADRPWWCHKIEQLSGPSDPEAPGPCLDCEERDGGCWRHRIDGAGYVPSPRLTEAKPESPA